jgi:ligand-binding sensor domain-containing protein
MNHGRLILFFFLFIAFLLRGCPVHAQTSQRTANLQFHLDVPINFILPDPKGFLWLATDKGLIRYDGSTTEIYTHDPQNPASLPINSLKYLLRDAKTGLIWIATDNEGLTCFDPKLPKNKAFTTYPSIPNDTTTVGGNVLNTLAMDKNGRIWIGGDGAILTELDPQTRKFTRHPEFGTDATIYSISIGENGNLWIGTRHNGLVLYNTQQRKILKQWSYEKEVAKIVKGFDKSINVAAHVLIAPDNQSAWFIYAPLGLIHIDFKTDEKEVYTLGFKPFDVAILNNMLQIVGLSFRRRLGDF